MLKYYELWGNYAHLGVIPPHDGFAVFLVTNKSGICVDRDDAL